MAKAINNIPPILETTTATGDTPNAVFSDVATPGINPPSSTAVG
jgi:hypothetical protein